MEQNTLSTGDLRQCRYCGHYFPLSRFVITNSIRKDGIKKLRTHQCVYCKQIRYKEYKKEQLAITLGLQTKAKINNCKPYIHQGVCLGSKQEPYYSKEDSESHNYEVLVNLTYNSLSEEEKEIYNNIKYEWRKKEK